MFIFGPDSFIAMARYIEAARRTGKLDTVPSFMDKAIAAEPRCTSQAKYYYCKGLLEWYLGCSKDALTSFNRAHVDTDFGLMASYHMVEICINPDNETVGGETFENVDIQMSPVERVAISEGFIKTAEKILAVSVCKKKSIARKCNAIE